MEYNTVCGLEVHTELSTKTKIFCNCSTAFGGEPNSHVCEICAGMPGTLPVVNERVVEYAVRTGLATNCTIIKVNSDVRTALGSTPAGSRNCLNTSSRLRATG